MNLDPFNESGRGRPPLDLLVSRYVAERLPSVPGDLESRVWREIRVRLANEREAGIRGFISQWWGLWRQPRVAIAGILAAAAIGAGMSASTAATAPMNPTRQALDLGVFSADPPSMPSTLLVDAVPGR